MKLPVLDSTRSGTAAADGEALARRIARHVEGEVRFDRVARGIYATDASNYRQVPIGVVIPKTIDDVIATVALCREQGAPITSRGAGTSLAGQCCNAAVIIDYSKYLNRIVDVDPGSRTARVQPGVVRDQLCDATEPRHGLTFGPDTSTHAWATFGGMLGNNACGAHSLVAGRTSDNTEALDVLTYDGARFEVGATDEAEHQRILAAGGRRADIYRGLANIRDRYGELIRKRYPDIPRRVSGYNLDDLLPERGFQIARSLVGTEGTCAVILEATVRLIESPPARTLIVLGYEDIYRAADHVPRVLAHGPIALEAVDDLLIRYMQRKGQHPRGKKLLPDGAGFLMVEFGGRTQDESDAKARHLMDKIAQGPSAPAMRLYEDPATARHLWALRDSALGATAYVPKANDTWPGWEDAAVHPEQLGDYLRDYRKLLDRFGYTCSVYGHFGEACVHTRLDFDLFTRRGIAHYRDFLEAASDLVVQYHGSFTAEHGDGQARAAFLPKMFGPELIDAMRRFKKLWDPDGGMNPGKVVDPRDPTDNLRLGESYDPTDPPTYFQFPEEGGFARAALRCVGVGKCRRRHDAFMCPSFVATHDEQHTTRGRARMLFEMLNGTEKHAGWRSEAVREALDLCLGCKGCKDDCPVSVDMATYKSEFLAHHYEGRLRPRQFYAMGWIGAWAKLAAAWPAAANLFGQTPPFDRWAKALAGVAPQRALPRFAPQTFTAWFDKHRQNPDPRTDNLVVLYPDLFHNHFHPGVLRDGLDVLGRLGFNVHVPRPDPPAIRPLLHYGFLPAAIKHLRTAVDRLAPFAHRGAAIVGFEPSTVSVFRDELPNLMPDDADGKHVAGQSCTFSEFLNEQDVALPGLPQRAIVHHHCHHKAVLHVDGADRLLRDVLGLDVHAPEPGCCGMAGSFGFEADHYELSMTIGRQKLIPAVAEADRDTLIIADGFSCRTQIEQATGRRPLHTAQVVRMALDRTL